MSLKYIGHEFIRKQEIVFSICMGLIAFLGRDNPMFSYPDFLWAFAAFMLFNLLYHRLLRRNADNFVVPFVSIAVNSLFITLILAFTGRQESYFWPLYLLPIFTACLYLEKRHVYFAALIPSAFLIYFSLESLFYDVDIEKVGLLIKILVLAFSAAVTMNVSFKERMTQAALEKNRQNLDILSRTMEPIVTRARSVNQVIGAVIHTINNQLSVILGSAEILLHHGTLPDVQCQDLERISVSTRKCGYLTKDLMHWLKTDHSNIEKIDLLDVLKKELTFFDDIKKFKQIHAEFRLPPQIPPMSLSRNQISEVFYKICKAVADGLSDGGHLLVEAKVEKDFVGIQWRSNTQSSEESLMSLGSCRLVMAQYGGVLNINKIPEGREFVVQLPLESK